MDPKSGGPCQGIRNIDCEMRMAGVEREVVCLDHPDSLYLGSDPFPVHALGPTITSWNYSKKLKPWLEQNLSHFDVIIVNGLWLYPGFAVRKIFNKEKKAKRQKGAKLFVMPHGMLDPYFQKAPERKWKALRNWFYWKLVEQRLIHVADGLLFTCQLELELARQTFKPYHPRQEFNVGYGIEDPPSFNEYMKVAFEEKCPAIKNTTYFLFLSRLNEKKGIDILLSAYNAVYKQHSKNEHQTPKLVIAGPGLETPYGRKIQSIVFHNPLLKNSVFFPGMLTGESKWGAFYGCEAFILPSHQENFGIAVVEALACVKPVLISNKVNIYKEIEEGEGGFVEINTCAGTEKLLNKWMTLTERVKDKMRLNARKTFQVYFSVTPAAKQLLKTITRKD